MEKGVCACEPGPPKPAREPLFPKLGAPGAPAGPAVTEAGNPENPDPKPDAAGVLNENEAADRAAGFPKPGAGVEVVMAEPAEDAAPSAGVFPNTEGLPEGPVAKPESVLKLKF